jgi:spore coat polysaccharide biosynthesis protein SpsF (cytidylyltransferase family)
MKYFPNISKYFLNILLVVVAVASITGCKKTLEEDPIGLLSPEGFFQSKRDVESAIFGAYGTLASEPLYGRQYVNAIMLRDDMCDIGNRGTTAERIQVNDFKMDATNGMVRAFWPAWYQVISAVNSAQYGAEHITLTEAELNPLLAEIKFVRAFSYFHLVRVFGDIPYIDVFISNPDDVKTISKTKEADVYTKIIAELQYAKQWLPDRQPNDIRTRPTKASAASYLAAVYLTTGDYQKAYTEAKWVIDNRATHAYSLEADFQNLFRAELANGLKETVFALDFLSKISVGNYNDDLNASMTGVRNTPENGFGVTVPSLATFTTWNALDYRRKVSFQDSTLNAAGVLIGYTAYPNEKRPHIAKWRRYPGNSNNDGRYSDHNYADMRYAEVLLIAAEALTETSGPTQEAIDYINQVRTRARNWPGRTSTFPANLALAGLTKQQLIDLVLEERKYELAFEWKRWFDIKRRKLGDILFKGPNSLEPQASFDANRDYLMPLPQTELEINPNLLPQNTGY